MPHAASEAPARIIVAITFTPSTFPVAMSFSLALVGLCVLYYMPRIESKWRALLFEGRVQLRCITKAAFGILAPHA
jgi:hypothetical protein